MTDKNEMTFNHFKWCVLPKVAWSDIVTLLSLQVTSLPWSDWSMNQSHQPMSLLDGFFLQFHWSIMDWDSFCFLLSMFISLSPYFKSFTHQTYQSVEAFKIQPWKQICHLKPIKFFHLFDLWIHLQSQNYEIEQTGVFSVFMT